MYNIREAGIKRRMILAWGMLILWHKTFFFPAQNSPTDASCIFDERWTLPSSTGLDKRMEHNKSGATNQGMSIACISVRQITLRGLGGHDLRRIAAHAVSQKCPGKVWAAAESGRGGDGVYVPRRLFDAILPGRPADVSFVCLTLM